MFNLDTSRLQRVQREINAEIILMNTFCALGVIRHDDTQELYISAEVAEYRERELFVKNDFRKTKVILEFE